MSKLDHCVWLEFGNLLRRVPCSKDWYKAYLNCQIMSVYTYHERMWLNQWILTLRNLCIFTGE